ncbi:MAG: 16S rRNA (cytosine(1402)-N(4))-methyltransferase RsmH [Candidatus Omnitrophota bacterium]
MLQEIQHIPVMLKEVVENLNLSPGACIVDCTLGLGGHAVAIAKQIGPQGLLIGIDRDEESIRLARESLQQESARFDIVQDDYRNIDKILDKLGVKKVDGIVFDLGISSYQLSSPARGFSFNSEGPLDMRLDQNSYISAYDIVNSLSEKEISTILRNFGQERWHNRIAHYVVEQRNKKPIASTKDLSDTVLRAIPARFRRQRIHPATRTFQAIRIAVNRELESLEIALEKCINYLKIGGRISVISFHSLEDKIVKEKFRHFNKIGQLSLIVKKPLRPTEEEVRNNGRSRSARLRVAERIN